jgi:23S rRNA (uridine2552-2'-O)-methyltransferase
MAQSKTSKGWLKEHFDDEYVRRSQEDGLRSRASYKLLEIQEKDKLIKRGMTVVDLGAAPGGWSQVAANLVGDTGRVVASDILPIDHLAGVEFLQGDFTEQGVLDQLLEMLPEGGADLVMSDMAPNMSGMRDIDQPRVMYLAELALDLARSVLSPGAYFLVKVFHGEGTSGVRKRA